MKDLSISAGVASEEASNGVTVYGEIVAQPGVTVRAVHVAGNPAVRTAFNHRAWDVEINQARLNALQEDGVAILPVVAYTNEGCAELDEDARPRVKLVVPQADAESDAGGNNEATQ